MHSTSLPLSSLALLFAYSWQSRKESVAPKSAKWHTFEAAFFLIIEKDLEINKKIEEICHLRDFFIIYFL